jgi:hypothetical protein
MAETLRLACGAANDPPGVVFDIRVFDIGVFDIRTRSGAPRKLLFWGAWFHYIDF